MILCQLEEIQKRVVQGWTPDVIVGRAEFSISCSMRTLYRMFKQGVFEVTHLPMKGKRKANGHKETRGKQSFRRSLRDRGNDYSKFNQEFGHLEGDTIEDIGGNSGLHDYIEAFASGDLDHYYQIFGNQIPHLRPFSLPIANEKLKPEISILKRQYEDNE